MRCHLGPMCPIPRYPRHSRRTPNNMQTHHLIFEKIFLHQHTHKQTVFYDISPEFFVIFQLKTILCDFFAVDLAVRCPAQLCRLGDSVHLTLLFKAFSPELFLKALGKLYFSVFFLIFYCFHLFPFLQFFCLQLYHPS